MVHWKRKHNTYGGALATKTLDIASVKVERKSVLAPHHFGNRDFRQHIKVAILLQKKMRCSLDPV